MSSQVLALFDSRIWSNDASERSQASLELVAYLQKAPESDVSYALKRILRGLGSPVDSSRSGFGLALTEVSDPADATFFLHHAQGRPVLTGKSPFFCGHPAFASLRSPEPC